MKRLAFRPAPRLLVLLACIAVVSLLSKLLADSPNQEPTLLYMLVAFGFTLVSLDWLLSSTAPKIEVSRICPNNISFNRWQSIELEFVNDSARNYEFAYTEHMPDELEVDGSQHSVILPSQEKVKLQYRIKPNKRGDYCITATEIRLNSPWRFWQRYWKYDIDTNIKVYPDFSRLAHGQNLNGVANLSTTGLKLRKKRGDGIEFHQLRDFRQGDSIRQIDWQATSKRQKLIAKEYQEEQNQHVIVMLDAGQRMKIETEAGTHFDAALNALLMLSHTVLKQGDWFSMQSFNQEERWLANVKGAQNVSRVMNHFYDLYPDESASDYSQAVESLLVKRSKRALILLVTTISDHDIEELLPSIKRLQQHHLVALINIENQGLKEALALPVDDVFNANSYAAAVALKNQYQYNLQRLRKEKVICVDTKPELLLPYVINTYLNVKHSGLL